MFSPLVSDFLQSAVLPAAVCAVLFFVIGGFSDPWRTRLQAVVLALAFVGGSFILVRRLSFPPNDVNESFSWVAILLAGFVGAGPRAPGPRYAVRALMVVAIGLLSFWQIRTSLHGYMHARNLLAFFFLGLGIWSIIERGSHQVQTLTLLVLPLISGTALSLLLLFNGSASFAQIVGVLCALLGGLTALAVVAPKRVSRAAILPFVSVFLICFMASGHFYLDINPWTMIYLCLPFFVLWIRAWIPLVPCSPIAEAVVLAVINAVPLGYLMWGIYQKSGPLF